MTAMVVSFYTLETRSTLLEDLEVNNIECVWVELKLNGNKKILLSVFYHPPYSGVNYQLQIEKYFGLAIDTGITEPTNCTEHFSSIIELFLSNESSLVLQFLCW